MKTLRTYFATFAVVFVMSTAFLSCASGQTLSYNLQRANELLTEDGDEKGALDLILKELEEHPNHSDALYMRARIAYANEKYGPAISDLTSAIRSYNNKKIVIYLHNLYLWRASAYEAVNENAKAKNDYDMAAKLVVKTKKPRQIQNVLFEQASFYYKIDEIEKSDRVFEQMLKNDETDQAAIVGLSRNLIKRDRFQEAITLLEKCELLSDDYSDIYRFKMQAYEKMGEIDKAIDEAVMYLDKDDNPSIGIIQDAVKKHLSYGIAKVSQKVTNDKDQKSFWMFVRARFYEWQHNYPKAIEQYDRLETDYGYDTRISFNRAECYSELGLSQKAADEITRIMEREDNEDAYLFLLRADYYRLAGDYTKAIDDFDKVIELSPADCFAYYRKGWCYEMMRKTVEALECYNAGIDVEKDYAYIYLNRGELLLDMGKFEQANADFEMVIQLDTIPESGSCRQYALQAMGRNEEALEWMEKVIDTDEYRAGGYYDKACLLARMGRKDDSLEALRQAVSHGYCQWVHMEHDDDLDPIRDMNGYTAIIAELKEKITKGTVEASNEVEKQELISEVPMIKHTGGTYEVACEINSLPLKLIFDTGASDVTISNVEANFMLKNGYLKESDIKGKKYYQVASGEIQAGTTITIREIKIGDAVLKNVEASVVHSQTAPLLLGQSAFERFGTITLDNDRNLIVIKQ